MFMVCARNNPYPMTVVGDVHETLTKLYGNYEILFQKEMDHCSLDPGGMLCIPTPYIEFQFDGNQFGIKADQIEAMLRLWKKAKISDDLAEVPMWMRVLVLPKKMYREIHAKLGTLHTSDTAIHAELTRNEIFMNLESKGFFLSMPPE
jgi:hypothetical protein